MKVGDYVRNEHFGIGKINKDYYDNKNKHWYNVKFNCYNDEDCHCGINEKTIGFKPSPNITELIEYMDLLELEHPVKLYDTDTTIGLFNPVRCDGFTTFEDGTHCIILNMDYIVDIKDLKIKSVLTHEQFNKMKYKVGD